MSGRNSALKIEWLPEAFEELRRLATSDQRRIKKVLDTLQSLDDPRQKLVPYSGSMKGFWKLRVGDFRLVCELVQTEGQFVLVISVAHRSVAYDQRSLRRLEDRRN
jgi:mRNA interferase RelE/StbE